MSFNTERLYDLLPAIYRIRDEHGEPLKNLLSVIAEQVAVLEENLDQLYDDQFIETCAEWVAPYIGDLIGYRTLHGVTPEISSPRAEVAHTIGFRRRKGTAAMLEQLARDVTGWNAHVVEFFQLLATTQYMNHIRPNNFYAPDLRQWEPLERLHTAFEQTAHTVEVRRIAVSQGKYNIPNLGIFLWRLKAYSLSESPAFKVDDRRYLFSPLGNNTPLFTKPETEDEVTHLAKPINVPKPISRRVLREYLRAYYGENKSLLLNVDGNDIAADDILVCNLSDTGPGTWAHMPPDDKYAIDPVLGRIALPGNLGFPVPVLATFHYGFSANMAGGEYERETSFEAQLQPVARVPAAHATIQAALNAIVAGGAVEIIDGGHYEEALSIAVNVDQRLELRAANEHRPTLVLNGEMPITGGANSEVTLNGLLITGNTLRVPAAGNGLRRLRLRHCTLVPGIHLNIDGTPALPDQPSLIVELANVTVEIDHCIVGNLRIAEGANVKITDSIIDATDETKAAYANLDGESAGGRLRIEDSTMIGKVHTALLELASNTIFLARLAPGDTWLAPIRSERKQTGCVRFSYLPLASIVPRRYRCRPENVGEEGRVRPQFTSLHYGDPGYAQITPSTPKEIKTGADDETEMGVFHKLYQPQRETNLRVRLEEYLRFGLEAGLFYAT